MDLDEWIESVMKTERPPVFPQSMYYSEGTKYLKLLQHEKALRFLDNAVTHDSTHIKSLLYRSKCHIGLRNYQKAIEDADRVLEMFPSHIHAIDLKGQAQYLMGDFESGYLTYLEGRKLHPASKELRLGSQLCRDALDKLSCGEKYFINDVVNIIKAKSDDKKFGNKLKKQKSTRECFGEDIKFMEDLMADKNLSSIHAFCREAVDYMKHRERFWCMETPFIARKRRQILKLKEIKKTNKAVKQIRICNVTKRRAENDLQQGAFDECISEAENLLTFSQSLPEQWEKEKMKFKCDGYHLLGLVYKKEKRPKTALEYLIKELKIATDYNLKLQQFKAYHQLGEHFQLVGDIKKTMQCFKKVIDAMEPEKIDELTLEYASPGDVQQIQEAHLWASSIIASIRISIRESIFKPIFDSIIKFSEEAKPEKFKKLHKAFNSEHHNLSNVIKDCFENLNQVDKKKKSDEKEDGEERKHLKDAVQIYHPEKSADRADVINKESEKSVASSTVKSSENLAELKNLVRELITLVSKNTERTTTGLRGEKTENSFASSEIKDTENLAELKNLIEELTTSVSEDTQRTIGLCWEKGENSFTPSKIKGTENLAEQNNLMKEQIDSDSEDQKVITGFCEGKTDKPITSTKLKSTDFTELSNLIEELISSVSEDTDVTTGLRREKAEKNFPSSEIKGTVNLGELNDLIKELINSILEEAETNTRRRAEKTEKSITSRALKDSVSFEEVSDLVQKLINLVSEGTDKPNISSREQPLFSSNVPENYDVNWTDETTDSPISDRELDVP